MKVMKEGWIGRVYYTVELSPTLKDVGDKSHKRRLSRQSPVSVGRTLT